MRALAKTQPAPGVEWIDVPEPVTLPGTVKLKVEHASVCGTDLHIYNWDGWSSSRVHPPRVIGHEFCGTIVEVGEGVVDRKVGDFVSSESHIVCGHCRQCLAGQGHVCVNTKILGVDVDGGFSEFAVIPKDNARLTSREIRPEFACFQDALGNAVHTAMAGPVEDQDILITGMGPIGLFAVAICRALGARKIVATEVSPYRIDLAKKMKVDEVLDPRRPDLEERLKELAPGGFDGTLEMSGHPSQLKLAIDHTRPGGRISLLGVFADAVQPIDIDQVIFKGIDLQGIVGRRLWETWGQMGALLKSGKLDLSPVVTHQMKFDDFQTAMELMNAGQAGKVVFSFE